MSYYNLEYLEVYQLAESFGDEVWFIVHEWDYFAKTRNLMTEDQFNLLFEKLQTIHLKLNAYLKFIGKSNTNKQNQ